MTVENNKKIDGVKIVSQKKSKRSREIVLKSIDEEIIKRSKEQKTVDRNKIDGIMIGKQLKDKFKDRQQDLLKRIKARVEKDKVQKTEINNNKTVKKISDINETKKEIEKEEIRVEDRIFNNKNDEWKKKKEKEREIEEEKRRIQIERKRKIQKELFKKEMTNIFSVPAEEIVIETEDKSSNIDKKADEKKKIEEMEKRKMIIKEREKADEEGIKRKAKEEKELEKEKSIEDKKKLEEAKKKAKEEKEQKELEEAKRKADEKKKNEIEKVKEKKRLEEAKKKAKEEKEKIDKEVKKKKKLEKEQQKKLTAERKLKEKIERKKLRKIKFKKFKSGFKVFTVRHLKNTFYVLMFALLSGTIIYSLSTILVIKLGVTNPLLYKAARYFPVPAMYTEYGYLDYFSYARIKSTYENYDSGKLKIEIARSLIQNKLLIKYNLPKNEAGVEALKEMLISDIQVNQVGINRINKLKVLIEKDGDFVKLSEKYGDTLDQVNITPDNKAEYSFGEDVIDMEVGQVSDVIYTSEGYYIFKCFDKDAKELKLSYVFIKAKSLIEFINEEIEGFKIWSLVD